MRRLKGFKLYSSGRVSAEGGGLSNVLSQSYFIPLTRRLIRQRLIRPIRLLQGDRHYRLSRKRWSIGSSFDRSRH